MNKPFVSIATISTLSHEGRGIARIDQKTTFIRGALPGETVEFEYTKQHSRFDEGVVTRIIKASDDRITPLCQYFGVCGGCSLQHLNKKAQIQHKEAALLEQLQRIGQVRPMQILPALQGKEWGYRYRARFHVDYQAKNNTMKIGFLQQKTNQIVDIQSCPILESRINTLLKKISNCLRLLQAKSSISQMDITVTQARCVLGFHTLKPFSSADQKILVKFCEENDCDWYDMNQKNYQDNHHTDNETLEYLIEKHNVRIQFQPTHFTQINPDINVKMIDQAIALLEPEASDSILDLFCGVGNFTLPIARYAGSVVGVEGNASSVLQATKNAKLNHIHHATFFVDNLFKPDFQSAWAKGSYTKIIIDPPRAGAKEIIPWIAQAKPLRIVYISCDTATLARDVQLLLALGYTLNQAGVMDMFPHTEHTEAIALLTL